MEQTLLEAMVACLAAGEPDERTQPGHYRLTTLGEAALQRWPATAAETASPGRSSQWRV